MSRFTKSHLLKSVAAATVLAFAALHAQAAPVNVEITSFSFIYGGGYGVDADENANSATLLDVVFNTMALPPAFFLDALNSTRTFDVGTIRLAELNANGGILSSETDELSVAAKFTFTNPFSSDVQVTAIGDALTGSVSDSANDFTITWDSLQIAFGVGGLLEISLGDLTFDGRATKTQTATVTLLNAPRVTPPLQVPEPGSMMLAGLALAGLGFVRRSRRS